MSQDLHIDLLGLSSKMFVTLGICEIVPFALELSQCDCVTQRSMIKYIWYIDIRYIDI